MYIKLLLVGLLPALAALAVAQNTTTVSPTGHSNDTILTNKTVQCEGFEVFVINNTLNIPYTVTCCLAVVFGFYFIIIGYRCYKVSLFVLGFIFATLVTFVIINNHTSLPIWGLIAVSLAVGLFCGLLTTFVTYCGLFLGGFAFGFFTGLAGFIVVDFFFHITIKWIPFGVLLGLSLLFGILTLRFQKPLFIIATSMVGGVLVSGGVDYFIEGFTLLTFTWNRIVAGPGLQSQCWITWVIMGIWPVLFIIGIIVQFAKTGRKFDHSAGKSSVSLQGEDKAMKRYRSLQMNGDVVAKTYYQEEGKPTEV